MSNQHQVYRETLKTLKQTLAIRGKSEGHVVTLAMLITGVLLSKKAQLSAISDEAALTMKNKSLEKRAARWVSNKRITAETYYYPFAREILAHLSQQTLTLAMDGSQVGRGCMALVIGVVYHHRLLPLIWVVYQGKKGHAASTIHTQALKAVQALIPPEAAVVLLGDGEYDTVELLTWLKKHTTWHWAMHTSESTIVTHQDQELKLADWPLARGDKKWLEGVTFTRQAFGPVQIVGWWGREYEEPLYLVTNLMDVQETCRYYHRRYRIETFFSDQKGRGFRWDKSHLAEPERLTRLLIAMSLAYICMIYLGIQVIHQGLTGLIDRTERRDLGYFQLGLRRLTYLLKHDQKLSLTFSIPVDSLFECVR